MKKEVLVIVGPTASGKTGLAQAISKKHNGAVVSADSRQVYAGLNIGTAKPRQAWRDKAHEIDEPDIVQGVPHYLLNILSPTETYSLVQWKKAAEILIDKTLTEGKRPIVAGGTMLYMDALVKNYELPAIEADKDFRSKLESEKTEDLYDKLIKQDPESKDFIESHNRRRIIRALEVIEATGKKFSDSRRQRPAKYDFRIVGLFDNWEALRERVAARAQEMLDLGLVDEIKDLEKRYGSELPLLKTINYAQRGDLEKMVQANMRYAHRQMSWWRRDESIEWFGELEEAIKILGFEWAEF